MTTSINRATSFLGLVLATPGIRYSDGSVSISAIQTRSTLPTNTQFIDIAQTITSVNTHATPQSSSYTAGPWLRGGLVSATPGVLFPDGTTSTTALTKFRTVHTWSIQGNVSTPLAETNYIPPFFVSIAAGETINLVKARYSYHVGTTPALVQLQKNDVGIPGYATLAVAATPTSVSNTIALAEDDKLNMIVYNVSKSVPSNLTMTLVLEHTA